MVHDVVGAQAVAHGAAAVGQLRRPAGDVALLEDDGLDVGLYVVERRVGQRHGRHEAGPARADDDRVVLALRGGSLLCRRRGHVEGLRHACGVHGVADGREVARARQGGARHTVDVNGLGLDDPLGDGLQGARARALALEALTGDDAVYLAVGDCNVRADVAPGPDAMADEAAVGGGSRQHRSRAGAGEQARAQCGASAEGGRLDKRTTALDIRCKHV